MKFHFNPFEIKFPSLFRLSWSNLLLNLAYFKFLYNHHIQRFDILLNAVTFPSCSCFGCSQRVINSYLVIISTCRRLAVHGNFSYAILIWPALSPHHTLLLVVGPLIPFESPLRQELFISMPFENAVFSGRVMDRAPSLFLVLAIAWFSLEIPSCTMVFSTSLAVSPFMDASASRPLISSPDIWWTLRSSVRSSERPSSYQKVTTRTLFTLANASEWAVTRHGAFFNTGTSIYSRPPILAPISSFILKMSMQSGHSMHWARCLI